MNDKRLRPIRSYVRRQGRMTKAQQIALETLWQYYGIDLTKKPLDFTKLFQRESDKILEIGFGMGEALILAAKQNPGKDYIGIDVHQPGVGALLQAIAKNKLENVRVICNDAVEVLQTNIANASLDAVYLFFPDPWPKKRHHKRRIVQPEFVELVRTKLKLGGCFHMATDWQNYAEHMMLIMNDAQGFINLAGAGHYAPRPSYRPKTKFEVRGENLGHKVWDLIFVRED